MALEKDLFTAILFSIWQRIDVSKDQTCAESRKTQELTSLCSLTSWGLAAMAMNLRSLRSSSLLRESCSFRLSCRVSRACSTLPFTDSRQRTREWKRWAWERQSLCHYLNPRGSSYRAARRCQSECRKRGCWTEVVAVCVHNAEPGPHRAVSYTVAYRQHSRINLGWPPPPAHQAKTPSSPPPLTSTHQPWEKRDKCNDLNHCFKYSQLIGQSYATQTVTKKVKYGFDLQAKTAKLKTEHLH